MNIIEKTRNVAKKVSASYACVAASCMTTMMAFAAGTDGNLPTYNPGDTGADTFSGMGSTLIQLINSAAKMLRGFIIPLASVAALAAIVMMYLPGMSSKVTDRCKTVIWSCIATIAIAAALGGIFKLAASVGQNINGSIPTV